MGRAGTGRRWLLGLVLLVVAAVAAGAVAWRVADLPDRRATPGPGAPTTTSPSVPAAPTGPDLPSPATAAAVAEPLAAEQTAALDAGRVRRALDPWVSDRRLGRHVVARVVTLGGGAAALDNGGGTFIPASTTKLLTTAAALHLMGPDHVFTTRTVLSGGRLVLVGGGDPLLASRPVRRAERESVHPFRADVVTLARETAAALAERGRTRVRVGYDDSLFTGPESEDTWESDYLPDDVVSPITALWVDEGRDPDGFGRVDDPAAHAADVFVRALTRAGVQVNGTPRSVRADKGAETLAGVDSAALDQIVERVLEVSDNEASEVLGHHVGLASEHQGSFAGGVQGVSTAMAELGVRMGGADLHDGSGLSRANRLRAATLTDLLVLAASADHPELRTVLTGLPVAGFTGSLTYRFAEGPAAGPGMVRAKTGTLTAVSGLAGLATDRTGTTMAFVLVADRVRRVHTLTARETLDSAAAALAACRCRA